MSPEWEWAGTFLKRRAACRLLLLHAQGPVSTHPVTGRAQGTAHRGRAGHGEVMCWLWPARRRRRGSGAAVTIPYGEVA